MARLAHDFFTTNGSNLPAVQTVVSCGHDSTAITWGNPNASEVSMIPPGYEECGVDEFPQPASSFDDHGAEISEDVLPLNPPKPITGRAARYLDPRDWNVDYPDERVYCHLVIKE